MRFPRQLRLDASERWLLVVVLAVLGYFHGGVAWNQNSRLNVVFAFVEPGSPDFLTLRMNRFLSDPAGGINTGDWSRVGDSYYSNKAPGPALLAIPFYALLYTAERIVGLDLDDLALQNINAYLINLWASVFVMALGAVGLRRVMLHAGTHARVATLLTLASVFGTGLFPYATQMWGHVTAAGLIALALAAYVRATPASLFVAGVAAGSAVVCDYLSALFAIALVLVALVKQRRRAALLVLGGALPAAGLMAYNAALFGSPFILSTAQNNPVFQEHGRVLGAFAAPSGEVLLALLVGVHRGILFHMPLLIFAFIGLVRWWRRDRTDPLLWLCGGTTLAFLLANSAFNGWHGGATVLARYLLPCLPLLCVALKEVPPHGLSGRLMWLFGLVSTCNMLAVAAVNPMAPDPNFNPLYGFTYQRFLAGALSPYDFPIRLQHLEPTWDQARHLAMWNWGQLLGLEGLWSLLPLAVAVAFAVRLRPPELRSDARAP